MAAAGQQREPILQTMGSSVVAESPAGSTITSPSRDSDSSDDTPLSQLNLKRPAQDRPTPKSGGKKAKGGAGGNKKKKKKDPNEPQKPVSAYALFFRDTQAAIKNQNPNATFGEVSKIVASMWDGLDEETKGGYKKRTEVAKKEYLKQLAAYRASLVSQGALDPAELEKSPPHLSPERPSPPRDNIAANTTTPLSHPPTPATTANQGGQLQPIAPKPANSSPSQNTAMDAASFYGTHQTGATGHQQQGAAGGGGEQPMAPPPSMCIRQGCQQNAVVHPNWDNEYCSNECVVDHCRDVFGAWVATRQGSGGGGNSFASVK
jgi:toll-like receptor 13